MFDTQNKSYISAHPVCISLSIYASELKTTGTITLENGVMFERSQVASNFNNCFSHLIPCFSLKQRIAKQVTFVKASNYTLNLSQNSKFWHTLVVAQVKTIEGDWHCTSIVRQFGFKDGGQVIVPV